MVLKVKRMIEAGLPTGELKYQVFAGGRCPPDLPGTEVWF